MMDKRSFLKKSLVLGMTFPFFLESLAQKFEKVESTSELDLAEEDEFWRELRSDYLLKSDYVNLENGYYCMLPQALLNAYIEHVKEVNLHASYYMRTKQGSDKKRIVEKLAVLADCSPEELVITRNATESLDLVINGMNWLPGDEAIMAEQDYGSMLDMFELMKERHGMIPKKVSVPNNPLSDDEIVELYRSKITPKTKLIMVCHMINITGHILPIRKICDMAHRQGVEVLVDGAHSFAHIPVSMKDLDCDYFGTSLHKWLNAPLGNGMLYVKRDKIKSLWPLFAESPKAPGNMARLNHTGTTPVHTILGIEDAINYQKVLGAKRKTTRLRFLQNYWVDKVKQFPNVKINTPSDPLRSCAIANVGVDGITPKDLAKRLLDEFKIWTVGIDRPGVVGCRITPNIYTTTTELDSFVDAIYQISKS